MKHIGSYNLCRSHYFNWALPAYVRIVTTRATGLCKDYVICVH